MAACIGSVAHGFSCGMGRYCRRADKVSASIDRAFTDHGWTERKFATQIRVDKNVYDSPTHKVDCFKNGIGLELEWNNKTEFYDRDTNKWISECVRDKTVICGRS